METVSMQKAVLVNMSSFAIIKTRLKHRGAYFRLTSELAFLGTARSIISGYFKKILRAATHETRAGRP